MTAYAAGQLMANSTTAGSVVPLSWTVPNVAAGRALYAKRATMQSTGKNLTNATFQIVLSTTNPTIASGDGAAFSTTLAPSVGLFSMTLQLSGSDVAIGWVANNAGTEINCGAAPGPVTIRGLIRVTAAYTPTSAEVETVSIEFFQK